MENSLARGISLAFLVSTLFLSCSFDYRGVILDEELSGNVPDAVLINFSEVSVKKGQKAYVVSAERAEVYNRKNLTVFTSLDFTEYDSGGSIATEGNAAKAGFYSDTENIEFSESFSLSSLQQGYSIKGEAVYWDGNNRTLSGSREKEITIGKDNGSFISGRGFRAFSSSRSFGFDYGAEGKFVAEDEENRENPGGKQK